jgi:uncharacterized protein (TIGR00725 family)
VIQVGVAAFSGMPSTELLEKCKAFVATLADECPDAVLVLGGYWGLMKCVVDEALRWDLRILLFPPLEKEDIEFPAEAIVARTGSSMRLRSIYLVRSSDVLIALGGASGTIQEVVTAYTEGIPVFILSGTGLPTDRLRDVLSPYLDDRRVAPITYISDPQVLAKKACETAKAKH